jgi:hypothetical protein
VLLEPLERAPQDSGDVHLRATDALGDPRLDQVGFEPQTLLTTDLRLAGAARRHARIEVVTHLGA